MFDDLRWEQEPRRPGSQQRRRPRRRRQRGGGRTFMALLISLLLLASLGVGVYWGVGWLVDTFGPADYTAAEQSTTEVRVRIPDGAGGFDMAEILLEKDVIKKIGPFVDAFTQLDGENIQPGTYRLYERMPAADAVRALLDRENNLVVNKVTIPEGTIAREVFALLSEQTDIPVADFEAAASDPSSLGIGDEWFARDDGVKAAPSVEGFLFPATYDFDPEASAEEMLTAMVTQFMSVATQLDFENGAAARNLTPYEVLITASIAEAEARSASDQGKVARTIYNRLYGDNFPTHVLELDSTVNYWYKSQGLAPKNTDFFTYDEIHNPDNPYNTHDVKGLPRGPIGNPGESALKAALDPPSGNWLFWVTVDDQTGETRFASSWSGHCQNIDARIANGYDASPC